MSTNGKMIGIMAAAISATIWGFSVISMKVLANYLNPSTITFLRYIVASLTLILMQRLMGTKNDVIAKEDRTLVAVSGFFGITLSMFFTTCAVRTIPASMAGLINGGIPIVTLLAEVFIFSKRPSRKVILAFILSFVGISLTVMGSSMTSNSNGMWIGILFMCMSIASWITYTFMTEPLSSKYSSICVLKYQTMFATLTLLPFAVFDISKMDNFFHVLTIKEVIVHLLFLGVVSSAIAYYAYIVGINKLGNSTASIFMNFTPIVSMFGAYIMLNDPITLNKTAGLVLVIVSILIVNYDTMFNREQKYYEEKENIS